MYIFSFTKNIVDEKYTDTDLNVKEELFQIKNKDLEGSIVNPRTSSALPVKEAYAIVVGVADYPGASDDLSYTDDDANDVYDMLVNDYNFKPSNIIRLIDSAATKDAISTALDQMATVVTPNDIFFFYYSGHGGAGVVSGGVQSYSINSPHPYPNDYDNYWSIYYPGAVNMRVHFDVVNVEDYYDYILVGDSDVVSGWYYEEFTGYMTNVWSSWIPLLSDKRLYVRFVSDYSITDWGFRIDKYEAEFNDGTHFLASYDSIPNDPSNYYIDTLLDSKLDNINGAEKYVILDACNTGGMIPEVQEVGRYIMTACAADELSLEDSDLQHGIFTNYFLRANDFASDSNGDGLISMEESYSYTYSSTVSYSGSVGYTHHPQEYDGISGEAVLYPSLGSLSLVTSANTLSYSFDLYGAGLIEELFLVISNSSQNNNYMIEDLTLNPATATGFGSYSGTVQLDGVLGIDSYGLFAKISGNQVIYLNQSVSQDSDGDLLDNLFEILIMGTDPTINDTDSDGLNDYSEFHGVTDPLLFDTDNDGLSDGAEILIYHTDPLNKDTDGDGFSDGLEVLWFSDPLNSKITVVTQILTISGLIMFGGSAFSVVRTKVIKKKHLSQKDKNKFSKFSIGKNVKTFNSLKVEKTVKPKPIVKIPMYQRPSLQSYRKPSYQPISNRIPIDINKIRDIIKYSLPPPKPRDSVEGTRGILAANIGFKLLNQGKYGESLEFMMNALMLGVPEPMNTRIKNIILDAINRISDQLPSNPQQISNYNNITYMKNCPRCGHQNKSTYKFCINCGGFI